MLTREQRIEFEGMIQSAKHDRLALVEANDKETGEPVAVVCWHGYANGHHYLRPIAVILDDPEKAIIMPEGGEQC